MSYFNIWIKYTTFSSFGERIKVVLKMAFGHVKAGVLDALFSGYSQGLCPVWALEVHYLGWYSPHITNYDHFGYFLESCGWDSSNPSTLFNCNSGRSKPCCLLSLVSVSLLLTCLLLELHASCPSSSSSPSWALTVSPWNSQKSQWRFCRWSDLSIAHSTGSK